MTLNQLKAENERLRGALKLALRYLDHPDVQAIPFAMHASCVADRVRAALEATSTAENCGQNCGQDSQIKTAENANRQCPVCFNYH